MSQIATNLDQSERLIKAGLRKETADMQWKYVEFDDSYWLLVSREDSQCFADFPAWSLSKLWDLLSGTILGGWHSLGSETSAELIESLVKMIEQRHNAK